MKRNPTSPLVHNHTTLSPPNPAVLNPPSQPSPPSPPVLNPLSPPRLLSSHVLNPPFKILYLIYATGLDSTNSPIESFNRSIKRTFTLNKCQSLHNFVNTMVRMAKYYSIKLDALQSSQIYLTRIYLNKL
ncbi:unnamed protein product [Brachionus calyciflorus]|uniref:Uncharacterized protein n=1 Tax=Brachionus calyciflorus TaxID=104777 RepID=A0A814F515_9BILA|nr:unnamed protein product [Brachionus calyciflorus]